MNCEYPYAYLHCQYVYRRCRVHRFGGDWWKPHICVTLCSHEDQPLPPTKTATLNLRIDPSIKEAARIAALREHRSVANLIELLIREYCKTAGIEIPTQTEMFGSLESDDE